MELLIAFLQRVLSGIQSGFGYAHSNTRFVIASIAMTLYPVAVYHDNWLWYTFFGVNAIVIFIKHISFDMNVFAKLNKFKDIHLWENFVTGGFVLYMCLAGYNIILIACSVYPALIIHKGFINLGSKLSFFAEATDDASGKTYSIPLLGIKVIRSTTKTRIILAIVSLVLAFVTLGFHFSIHL